jgi:hypothetical protein
MPKFIDAELFGMTIRESANDGSDFTNPSADSRRLFLGEDGQLHVKDSAGTVTDIGTGSGINSTIVDAKGDIIAATAADTVARLAVGANDTHLVAASGESTGLKWVAPLAAAGTKQVSGADYTTTSGTYADIDGTNLSVTLTTAAHRVLVTLTCGITLSSISFAGNIDVLVDGASDSGLGTGAWQMRPIRASEYTSVTWSYMTAALTAASHTIKLQWKTSGGTLTINRSTFPCTYTVQELPI